MKKIYYLIIVILFYSNICKSQDFGRLGTSMKLIFGVNYSFFNELNNELEPLGFKKINSISTNLGIGGSKYLGNYLLSIDFSGYLKDNDSENKMIEANAISVSVMIGRNILRKKEIELLPMIGFSVTGFDLHLVDVDSTSVTINQAFQDIRNRIKLTRNSINFDIGLQFNYFEIDNQFIGFKLGYKQPFYKYWIVNGETITGGPKINADGIYLFLQAGFLF